jgi:penicillin-binding protein-related factor A (putative recombinase)
LRNTGKPSEELFENSILALGKAGYFYRIKDAADIRGITGRVGQGMDATPSDYIVSVHGEVSFAEVKSTNDLTKFPFSLLKKGQKSHGKRIVASGGSYRVYIHRLKTDTWYCIPLRFIHAVQDAGAQSIPWEQMEKYKWHLSWKTP